VFSQTFTHIPPLVHLHHPSQMSSSIPSFAKLNSNNFNSWSGDMEAWYRAQALWRIVSGAAKTPTLSIPAKEGEEDKLEAWQVKADKAAGNVSHGGTHAEGALQGDQGRCSKDVEGSGSGSHAEEAWYSLQCL
jgi:hypothetical protein